MAAVNHQQQQNREFFEACFAPSMEVVSATTRSSGKATTSAGSSKATAAARLPEADVTQTCQLVVQGMAAVWSAAFASLYVQLPGTYGPNGITPALGATPSAMEASCLAGLVLSIAATAMPQLRAAPAMGLLWGLYRYLVMVTGRMYGDETLDALLLESGLLSAFAAWKPQDHSMQKVHAQVAMWLVRSELFRYILASGIAKLSLGMGPAHPHAHWWQLTALPLHLHSQCFPSQWSWSMSRLPGWLHKGATAMVLADQVLGPLLFWAPAGSTLRLSGFASQLALQLGIQVIGNYGPLNMLTSVLCLSLLDDATLQRWTDRCKAVVVGQEAHGDADRVSALGSVSSGAAAPPSRLPLSHREMQARADAGAEGDAASAHHAAGRTAEAPEVAETAACLRAESMPAWEMACWSCFCTVAMLCFGPPWSTVRMVRWQFTALAELVVTLGVLLMAQDANRCIAAAWAAAPVLTRQGLLEGLLSLGSASAWTLASLPGLLHDTWPSGIHGWPIPVVDMLAPLADGAEEQFLAFWGTKFNHVLFAGGVRPSLAVLKIEAAVHPAGPWKELPMRCQPPTDIYEPPKECRLHIPVLETKLDTAFQRQGTKLSEWLYGFLLRLSSGDADAVNLLDSNAFHRKFDAALPKFFRLVPYHYDLALTTGERGSNEAWWSRQRMEELPAGGNWAPDKELPIGRILRPQELEHRSIMGKVSAARHRRGPHSRFGGAGGWLTDLQPPSVSELRQLRHEEAHASWPRHSFRRWAETHGELLPMRAVSVGLAAAMLRGPGGGDGDDGPSLITTAHRVIKKRVAMGLFM